MHRFRFALFLLAPIFVSRPAEACSFPGPVEHEIDPAEQAIDKEPPGRVETVGVSVTRGKGPEGSGCTRRGSSSCDDIGWITLIPAPPSDNRTPKEELGYRLRFIGGRLPDGLRIPDDARRLDQGEPPSLGLRWIDGSTDDQEDFDFTVMLTAIDKAGNEGPESAPIRIHHGGSSGCRMARGGDLGSFALVLGALIGLGRISMRRFPR